VIPTTVAPCTAWTPLGCTNIDPSGAAISGTMLAVAQEILYFKSGQQFDQCTLTLRPCRDTCFGAVWPWGETWSRWGAGWPYPYLYAGQWFNLGCAGCGAGGCSCSVVNDILLPFPVAAITDVTIDGVSLTPLTDHVILYDQRQLVRIDGQQWPQCNDLSKKDGQPGTWSVTITQGTPVPPLGQVALGELTKELVNACIGTNCKLPNNIQAIVRQGVSQTMFDPTQMFGNGKIGLYMCDLFLGTYNPHNIRERARAIDPERHYAKQVSWP
jgi:hypothetical protein